MFAEPRITTMSSHTAPVELGSIHIPSLLLMMLQRENIMLNRV